MVEYKYFKVGELFKVTGTKSSNMGDIKEDTGGINFVGRTATNNGIQMRVREMEFEPNEAGTITVSQVGTIVSHYQEEPYYTSQNIAKLYREGLGKGEGVYITAVINKHLGMYGGYVTPKLTDIKEMMVKLPVRCKQSQYPDWEYMEDYIKQKELEYINKLDEIFNEKISELEELIGGVENKELNIKDVPKGKFKIGDLFEVKHGKQPNIAKRFKDKQNGMVNCITGVTEDNGIGFYTDTEGRDIYVNEITLAKDGEYAGTAYIQTQEFTLAGHSTGLIKKEEISNKSLLYIGSLLNRIQNVGYWKHGGVMGSVTNKKLNEIYLSIPIKEELGEIVPDWETMEDYVEGVKYLYKHREEGKHKEKLDLLLQLTGYSIEDLTPKGFVGGGGRVNN